jgi:hypothetical protein
LAEQKFLIKTCQSWVMEIRSQHSKVIVTIVGHGATRRPIAGRNQMMRPKAESLKEKDNPMTRKVKENPMTRKEKDNIAKVENQKVKEKEKGKGKGDSWGKGNMYSVAEETQWDEQADESCQDSSWYENSTLDDEWKPEGEPDWPSSGNDKPEDPNCGCLYMISEEPEEREEVEEPVYTPEERYFEKRKWRRRPAAEAGERISHRQEEEEEK